MAKPPYPLLGYGGIIVANAFAYRCTDKRRLIEVFDPVGPENVRHILEMAREAGVVVSLTGNLTTGIRAREVVGLRRCW